VDTFNSYQNAFYPLAADLPRYAEWAAPPAWVAAGLGHVPRVPPAELQEQLIQVRPLPNGSKLPLPVALLLALPVPLPVPLALPPPLALRAAAAHPRPHHPPARAGQ
jgi:hypothetical protein